MGEDNRTLPAKIQAPTQAAPEDLPELLRKRAPLWVDLISTIFWIFVLIKLFVIDIDRLIFRIAAPSFEWLLDYRFLFYFGILASVALLSKAFKLWRWVFYVVFFPFILVLWKIPIFIYLKGSLDAIFMMLYILFKTFASARKIIITSFLFLLSAALCTDATDWRVLYSAASLLVCILYYLLLGKTVHAVKSSRFLERVIEQIETMQEQAVAKINGGPSSNELVLVVAGNASNELISGVESALLTNRILLIIAKQLRRYKSSTFAIIQSAFDTTSYFMLSVATYFFVYHAIYIGNKDSFELSFNKSPFVFFAVSFKSMIFGSVNGVAIKTQFAQLANITQNFSSFVLLTIFGSMLLVAFTQKRNEQFDRIIDVSEAEGFKIEQALIQKYGQRSINSFLEAIRGLKGSTVSLLLYLTRQIDR